MVDQNKSLLRRMTSYSILKSMHDHGFEKYADCFVPVVVQALSKRETATEKEIQAELDSFFPMPLMTITKLLLRACQKEYVNVETKEVDGNNIDVYSINIEKTKELILQPDRVEKDISSFIKDVEKYFRNNNFKADRSVLQIVESFLDDAGILSNITNAYHVIESGINVEKNDIKSFIGYLRANKTTKHIGTFQEIVKGSVVARALAWTDLDSVNYHAFRKCEVFMDTNCLFSLLGFHGKEKQEVMSELVTSIKFLDFRLRVFDFTLHQFETVLKSFDNEKVRMQAKINSIFYGYPSVYSVLLKRSWSKDKILDYINNLEKSLDRYEIKKYATNMQFQDNMVPEDHDLESICSIFGESFAKRKYRYPVESNNFGKLHDLAAIVMIKRLRNNEPVSMGDPKAIFLTSDNNLAKFNQFDMPHDRYALPEIVLDTDFSALTWFLSKDETDVSFSLEMIISAYAQNTFINEVVWEQFIVVFNGLIQQEAIDVSKIPNIFFKNIQNDLCEMSDKDVPNLTNEFIKERIILSGQDEQHYKQERDKIINEKDDAIKEIDHYKEKEKNIHTYYQHKISELKLFLALLGAVVLVLIIIVVYYMLKSA